MYLCNVQHCIYKVHLNTGFSSNTETTINRFDITVFFFSSAVFKWTQKCIFNIIQFWQIIPTQLVHTQAKLFKCTMIDLRSKRVPVPPLTKQGELGQNTPTTHMHVCMCVSARVLIRWVNLSPSTHTHTHSHSPSSCRDEVRATQIHQVIHKQYTEIK